MKLKRWYLYVIATLCFALAFTALNFKYDRFYRVNGINNDNRALIEMYLSQEEQDYLIDNAIAVDKFIDYIELDDFYLPYYQYYNSLRETKRYHDLATVVASGNKLADKLKVEFGLDAYDYFSILIKNDLESAYLNSEYFNFDYIPYYQLLRTLYDDYSYILIANLYVEQLTLESDDEDEVYSHFKDMVNSYNANDLNVLMNTPLSDNVQRLYHVDIMKQVVNADTFIASYEPKKLVMIEGIPRIRYSMNLQNDAYTHLVAMYKALNDELGEGFIVTKSYLSYDVLSLGNQEDVAGFSEFQFGTSVELIKEDLNEADFIQSDVYQWLIEHCYQYGYILRYPGDKTMVTQHEFDGTIFRYVGEDIATQLHDYHYALEEYNHIPQDSES